MRVTPLIALIFIISCHGRNNNIEVKKQDTIANYHKPKIISDPTNILESKIQKLELEYILWGCACANWITPADRIKYDTNGLAQHCIFIEPADGTLSLPDSNFKYDSENIRVTGQFYVRKDYPQGTVEMEETLEKAKVFRFTKIQIVKKK